MEERTEGSRLTLPIYRNILVPLDGSERAEAALPHAAALAKGCGAHVLLQCIVQSPLPVPPSLAGPGVAVPLPPPVETVELAREARDAMAQYLEERAGELRALGISAATVVDEGEDVAEQIVEVAQDGGIDLIVMTTHGRTGLGRLLFGSVAESVLRRAAVPVLLIRTVESE